MILTQPCIGGGSALCPLLWRTICKQSINIDYVLFFFSLCYHKEFLKPDFKKDLQLGTEAVSGPFGYKKGHSVYEQAYVRGT